MHRLHVKEDLYIMVKRSRIVAFLLLLLLFASTIGTTTNSILKNIKLGLDLQGGFEVLYEVEPAKKGQKIDQDVLKSTVEALDKRINVLGVSEPVIQIEGENRIRVQLAGVTDQNNAREILSTEANLTFRNANDEIMMDGTDLVEGGAQQTFDENNQPSISLQLKSADTFREVTQKIVDMAPQNQLIIWLDFEEGKDSYQAELAKEKPKFLSNPNVNEVFNQDTVSIVGNFQLEEAKTLASLLNAGALPVKLNEVYSTSVGAQFGEEALNETIFAGIIGIALIYLFLIVYYRFPGFIAVVTLTLFSYLILLIFDWMNGVLTLPGIAALILGVGMAVDANIITYERIKEELKVGRNIKAAFEVGSKGSFWTIFDANITTLIAAGVLFFYGTSSVKGFATSLIISILASFITNVYVSRLLLGLWVKSGFLDTRPGWFGVRKKDIKDLSEGYEAIDLPTRFDRFDFVKNHKIIFGISGVLFTVGLVVLIIFRMNLGIDFASGTRMEVPSDKPINIEQLKEEFLKFDLEVGQNVVMSGDNNDVAVVRFLGVLSKDEIADIREHFKDVYGSEPTISTVSPTVGKELAKNAIIAVAIASIGIILYVTLRFEWRMALASIVALLHDVFFIIVLFSLTRLEVDLTFIAAVLTIIGYSINDTIVTFDRIRENLEKKKRIKAYEELVDIVNSSIRQTLARSVNTVLMVVISVVALLLWGSESILNFSLALLVGLVVGAYSSIFIASQLWLVWKNKELKQKGVLITEKVKVERTDEPQV